MSTPTAAAMPAPEGVGYRIPSLGYRILIAALRLMIAFVLLVVLPVAVLTYVHSRGIPIPVSIVAVTTWGVVLLALTAARYVLKPTAAYGPLSFLTALVFFLYLYFLYSLSPYRLSLASGSVSLAAGYSMFLEILMIVPIVEMVAAVFTTIEDAVSPKERLLFDYPA
jgi:hypothetical protein